MRNNGLFRPPEQATAFVGADASLRQLQPPAHLIFLFVMFLLPALFGRFLFLGFTLPLAHRFGIHPAASSALLVNVLMLFELALLLAAFYLADRLEGGRVVTSVLFGHACYFGCLGGIGSNKSVPIYI